MNDHPDIAEDKAAFPRIVTPWFDAVATGMTLRDYFAAAALQGTLSSCARDESFDLNLGPAWAYQVADAMLEARKQSREA